MDKIRANTYLVIDFETGGIVNQKNKNPESGILSSLKHPVTEFACLALRGDDFSELFRYDNLIKPYDDSLEYTTAATHVSGISEHTCMAEGISLIQLKNDLSQIFKECNQISFDYAKTVIVGHNISFDYPFLQNILFRCGINLSDHLMGDYDNFTQYTPNLIDTMQLSIMAWGGDIGITSYALLACCQKAGIEVIKSHRALSDVISTAELFRFFAKKMRF